MKDRDGGPAFPGTAVRIPPIVGMSLRDWFAGQALSGLVVTADETSAGADLTTGAAYEYADAMLKARDV